MTQPEALRLAEQLEAIGLRGPVATELRRLHAEVERLSWDSVHTCHAECQRPMCRLTRERDALLEACRAMLTFIERHAPRGLQPEPGSPVAMARAAIKAVEEQK